MALSFAPATSNAFASAAGEADTLTSPIVARGEAGNLLLQVANGAPLTLQRGLVVDESEGSLAIPPIELRVSDEVTRRASVARAIGRALPRRRAAYPDYDRATVVARRFSQGKRR